MISMKGVEPPSEKKAVYTRDDVYPIVFQYHLNQSDALMTTTGSPGFEEIKSNLKQAGAFASTPEEKAVIDSRLKTIDRTVLVFKADVAAAKKTAEGLQTARVYLNKAATLNPGEIEAALIQSKLESVQQQLAALQSGLEAQPSPPQVTETPPPAPETDEHKSPEPFPTNK